MVNTGSGMEQKNFIIFRLEQTCCKQETSDNKYKQRRRNVQLAFISMVTLKDSRPTVKISNHLGKHKHRRTCISSGHPRGTAK